MHGHVLRASWVASALATLLALGTPVLASVTGDDGASSAGASTWASRTPFADRGPSLRPHQGAPQHHAAPRTTRRRHRRQQQRRASEHLLVRIPAAMTIRTRPSARAAVVGTMPTGSKYYGVPITAWVEATARHGRWGRVEIPYAWPRRDGWIPLRGLARTTTHVEVEVDLSRHWVDVTKFGRTLFGLRAATGSAVSPTPPGEYFVTDRIPFSAGSALGSFAFGISGIQPHLPPGWSGGNQLAIHGTNDPSSIGTSASAGCMRVSERGLHRLMPLLRLGTPVIVHR
jgi:lipoprotein-anchoring transpeptidase ErfK/SrfK